MAAMDKLTKALEALKVVQSSSSQEETQPQKKKEAAITAKEKITHCNTIAETICSYSLRTNQDFTKLLGFAMETFFHCCDDENSDVRLTANECLNKTIKMLLDSHLVRLQVELYKEIKKDGAARSLRAALSRFADMCHLIRPQKCRPYTVNLLPCLAKISQRVNDESVQDTLAVAISKIMPILGQFTNDKEIKVLLKAFLPNLSSNSATVRRSAATSLVAVCQYSRRPAVFYSWIVSALFELIIPVPEDYSVSVVVGVLLCLRYLAPHLNDVSSANKGSTGLAQNEEDITVTKEQLLKVYEITLYFMHYRNHNIVTAALETLCQLLKFASKSLKQLLISPNGISKSQICVNKMQNLNRFKSESQGSIVPQFSVVDDINLEDEHDIGLSDKCDDDHSFVEDESKENFELSEESVASLECESDDVSEYSDVKIGKITDDSSTKNAPDLLVLGTPKKVLMISEEVTFSQSFEVDMNQSQILSCHSERLNIKAEKIGTFTDPDVPLNYCARLICSSFLLSGTRGCYIPDASVRVSVKSLALSCLSCIFSLHPKAFFIDVYLNGDESSACENQKISDTVLYTDHPDPHLKGQTAFMIGSLVHSALIEARGSWEKWCSSFCSSGMPCLKSLLDKIVNVLQNDSSVASKLALSGLKCCFNTILNSVHGFLMLPILKLILSLTKNSYWLTRVELMELVANISYNVIYYLESQTCMNTDSFIGFQNKVFLEVFIPLLASEDARVRQASASAIVKVVPNLFFPVDHPHQDPVSAVSREYTNMYLGFPYQTCLPSNLPHAHALVKPFHDIESCNYSTIIESALTRIISLLVQTLKMSTNKYLTYGCCQVLLLLSEAYSVIPYYHSWCITFCENKFVTRFHSTVFCQQNLNLCRSSEVNKESILKHNSDLLSLLITLMTYTPLSLDASAHHHALQLAGNLICGFCYGALVEKQKSSESSLDCGGSDTEDRSPAQKCFMSFTVEQMFIHLMKLLNIFSHVLDEQLPLSVTSRSALPSLPNPPSISPIKRKNKSKEEVTASNNSTIKGSPGRLIPEKNEIDREREKNANKYIGLVGDFQSSPLYMKLFDYMKGAYASYKISMDFQSNEKFCLLLKCTLDVLSQLLEIVDALEMDKYAEEILGYLKITMLIEPCSSIQCVRQLLKSLFGTNLITLCPEFHSVIFQSKESLQSSQLTTSTISGLYDICIALPYTQFTHSLASKTSAQSFANQSYMSSLSWIRRSDKLTNLLKSGTKGDKANLAAHIRLFEGVVIKALKQYTVTSNVKLQCQVLDLLAQLVQLRVNYCLLDSDQIFIDFVIKQFDYIEEGQILNAETLIPRIFYFLVLLSYEKYHSKSIITVPKILQLCDGLIASEQPPDKFVIPALQPVVEDLFILRGMNKADHGKELDAQREVVLSTLFKLAHYSKVLELFVLIINQASKEGEDKWRKLSRQIVDVILPLLSRQLLHIDSRYQLDVLHKLLESVSPNVFRPVDILLKALFVQPRDLNMCPNFHRWLSLVLTLLKVLMSQTTEEVVLSRMSDMNITVKVCKLGFVTTAHHLQSYTVGIPQEDQLRGVSEESETTFARFLFQVVGVTVETIYNNINSLVSHQLHCTFVCQQMAHALLYLAHMFQSGTFRKVTSAAMEIIKIDVLGDVNHTTGTLPSCYSITEINNMFLMLSSHYPTLVIQWCNVLTLLNYDNQKFWSQIIQPQTSNCAISYLPSINEQSTGEKFNKFLPCNLEMVRRSGITLLCDYVCENPNDAELMTWLIVNHINDLINLSLETTVQDFLSAIHRNPAASGLLIQAVSARCIDMSKSFFQIQALHCLEAIHISQTGSLLTLLVEKFLPTHLIVVARMCDSLICRRIEILLADSLFFQILPEDIDKLISTITCAGISCRHQHLIYLLIRLKRMIVDSASSTAVHPLISSPLQIQDTVINKVCYMKYVRERCCCFQAPIRECAYLLSQLKYEDALEIMTSKDFYLPILEGCLKLGAKTIPEENHLSPTKSVNFLSENLRELCSPLFLSACDVLFQHIAYLSTQMAVAPKYENHIYELFSDKSHRRMLCQIASATVCYLTLLDDIPYALHIPANLLKDIAKLSILCCEAVAWVLTSKKGNFIDLLETTLSMLNAALKNPNVSAIIELPAHSKWVFSAFFAVDQLVNFLHLKLALPDMCFPVSTNKALTDGEIEAQKTCIQVTKTVELFEAIRITNFAIPRCVYDLLFNVVQGLSRFPLVNSFVRTPPVLWKLGWLPELTGNLKTIVPPPSGEYLQDRDVLKQYIYRINLLGWVSRQQFEETWMALLGVLSATPIDHIAGKEEDQERIRTSCLAVKSITSLLLQTLLLPQPGNPQNSFFLSQSRDKPPAFFHTKYGKKLLPIHTHVQKVLYKELHIKRCFSGDLLCMNTEKTANSYAYSFSQVSLEYLRIAANLFDSDENSSESSSPKLRFPNVYEKRKHSLEITGLDIHSCLHFLLDLYSQWLSPSACPGTPLTLLTEVVRSVVILSDIFMEKAQFEWMLDTLLEVQRIHPAEDEIITQYLIFGICKAAAVLGMEQDLMERLKKILEVNLKSTYLPTRISTLHGFLFLLEHGFREETFPLLSTVSDYILKYLEPSFFPKPSSQNMDHVFIMWAVAFYILENSQDEMIENEFKQKIYQLCLSICDSYEDDVPDAVYLTILHGLEHIIGAEIISGKELDYLLKSTASIIKSGSCIRSLAALKIFLLCMYIGKSTNIWSSEFLSHDYQHTKSNGDIKLLEKENLIIAMERVSTLFERIRRGYPLEAEVICQFLPHFLMEFFPIQDVLNKVIGEFLSNQQPHPKLIAGVIHKIFYHLHQQSNEGVIQDWVMLSLSNFTQRTPVAIAIWCLSCIFVSASSNFWLQSLFPFVQNRMGKMEESDRELFCIAGLDFYKQLKNEEQRQAYHDTIMSVTCLDTPYGDLLCTLKDHLKL